MGYVGKLHLGAVNLDPGEPGRFGFDDYWRCGLFPSHDYYDYTYCSSKEGRVEGEGKFRPAAEVDMVFDFLDGAEDDDRPWFCLLSWGPPHDPFEPPPRYRHYDDVPLPPNVPTGSKADPIVRRDLPLYYGLIEALDDQFGRLLSGLARRGMAEDTIVVYTSDHGNMMGSFNYLGKEMPYHESTGIPFLARWPGKLDGGRTVGVPLGSPDVFPTLVGLSGLEAPAGLDGRDLSGRLLGAADAPGQEAAYLAAWDTPVTPWPGWRGVRTERHLYARRKDRPWMLFDLQEDPWQQRDLRKEDIPLRRELDGLTLELMEQLGDSWEG